MSEFLGLTDGQPVPEGYDRYIWISERCLEGISYCKENGLEYEVVPRDWATADEIRGAVEYLDKVGDEIILFLTPQLNGYSNVSYGPESWEMMLRCYLDVLLNMMLEKYLRILWVREHGIEADCYIYEEEIAPMLDYADLADCVKGDEFHQYAYTLLLSEMEGLEGLRIRRCGKYGKKFPDIEENRKNKIKMEAFALGRSMLRGLRRRKDKVVLIDAYLPMKFVMRLMLKHPGKVSYYFYNYRDTSRSKLEKRLDKDWRRERVPVSDRYDEFTQLMCRVVRRLLPTVCVENFLTVEKISGRIYRYARQPKAIFYTSSAFFQNEFIKNYMMRMKKEKATKFFCIQHGGYGMFFSNIFLMEFKNCHRFYTWGWQKSDFNYCEFKPMPVPKMLEERQAGEIRDQGDILYVDYVYSKNVYEVSANALFYDQIRDGALDFFKHVAPEIRDKIVVRIFPTKKELSIDSDLRRLYPLLRRDVGSDFYKSVNSCSLILLGDFQTTIFEVLYLDRPFIAFMDQRMQTLAAARQDLMLMEDIGVLVRSFDDMRSRVEEVYPRLKTWWEDKNRSKAIAYLREKYARYRENPKAEWEKEICSYL